MRWNDVALGTVILLICLSLIPSGSILARAYYVVYGSDTSSGRIAEMNAAASLALAGICLDQYAAGAALVAIGISTGPVGWAVLAGIAGVAFLLSA